MQRLHTQVLTVSYSSYVWCRRLLEQEEEGLGQLLRTGLLGFLPRPDPPTPMQEQGEVEEEEDEDEDEGVQDTAVMEATAQLLEQLVQTGKKRGMAVALVRVGTVAAERRRLGC